MISVNFISFERWYFRSSAILDCTIAQCNRILFFLPWIQLNTSSSSYSHESILPQCCWQYFTGCTGYSVYWFTVARSTCSEISLARPTLMYSTEYWVRLLLKKRYKRSVYSTVTDIGNIWNIFIEQYLTAKIVHTVKITEMLQKQV